MTDDIPGLCPACYTSMRVEVPEPYVTSYCPAHEPSRGGVDDALVPVGSISMSEEAGGEDNRKWCALFARKAVAAVGLLLLAGCSHTNIAELVTELGKDPNANCIQFNAGPYGSVLVARGTPNANVRMGPGQCEILGSNVTTVTVPASSIIVNPQYLQGLGQGMGTH